MESKNDHLLECKKACYAFLSCRAAPNICKLDISLLSRIVSFVRQQALSITVTPIVGQMRYEGEPHKFEMPEFATIRALKLAIRGVWPSAGDPRGQRLTVP